MCHASNAPPGGSAGLLDRAAGATANHRTVGNAQPNEPCMA